MEASRLWRRWIAAVPRTSVYVVKGLITARQSAGWRASAQYTVASFISSGGKNKLVWPEDPAIPWSDSDIAPTSELMRRTVENKFSADLADDLGSVPMTFATQTRSGVMRGHVCRRGRLLLVGCVCRVTWLRYVYPSFTRHDQLFVRPPLTSLLRHTTLCWRLNIAAGRCDVIRYTWEKCILKNAWHLLYMLLLSQMIKT